MNSTKHYAKRDPDAQGIHYINHVSAMTTEGLHAESAIAAELAHRDIEIERLRAALVAPAEAAAPAQAQDKDEAKAQRLTEKRWLEVGKAVERACIELPQWAEVVVSLEKDAGTVKWFDGDGNEYDSDTHGDCFSETINNAIDAAIAAQ